MPTPGYTTVREIVHALDPGLTALADGGDAAYRDKFELVYRRSTSAPNEQWQMDHTLLDVMILNDRQQPVRPWLTIVLDDYSRAIAGYALGVSAPTAEHSALAIHQAVARKRNPKWVVSGLPDVPLQRSRVRFHLDQDRTRLPRPTRAPDSLPGRRSAGARQDRTVLPHHHDRAAAAPARVHPARHRRVTRQRTHADLASTR
ncbi:DDE-type integrase/transposase/recombinase [Microbacterium oxydans]|nr:DDE-type integrase/transposase/recombinase [Microbacterium oxydans]